MPLAYAERPAHAGDLEAMFDCFRKTMQFHVAAAFGWDEDFQRTAFMGRVLDADCSVLEVQGEFAGFAWVDVGDAWSLRLLCIEPKFQGRGIGSHRIDALVRQAAHNGAAIVLKVLRTNQRAAQLYERLGFVRIEEDGHGIKMRCDTSRDIAAGVAVS